MLLLVSLQSWTQVERTRLIGAYVYNFARYTYWPESVAKSDSFNILIISDDKLLIKEFIDFSKVKKINGKAISISVNTKVPSKLEDKIKIVFLDNEKSEYFKNAYNLIDKRSVLIVTENYTDKYMVMINLYDDKDNKLFFELNKSNIINHNLKLDPEVLLLGGTEIDVAELYRNLQKEMDSLQDKIVPLTDSLNNMNDLITLSLSKIDSQSYKIEKQNNLLEEQSEIINKGKEEVKDLKTEIGKWEYDIKQKQESLNKQAKLLEESKTEQSEQQNYIEQQYLEIKKSKTILDSLATEISTRNLVLDQQKEIISKQKQLIILAITSGVLLLLVILSGIGSYSNKIKKNRILSSQKEEIERINIELEKSNSSLNDTIKKLGEMQSQLVSAEKMVSLGVLTAGIAHEINNPVNFIYTGINSLRKDYNELMTINKRINDVIVEYGSEDLKDNINKIKSEYDLNELLAIIFQTLEDIKTGSERTSDIIKGLRNFSRLDKDAMQLFDIHEGIESALLLLRNKFKNHITIEKNYEQLPKIECYPGKLNQAFLNILSNSIDAIEKEGTITITTKLSGDYVKIIFKDSGMGIPDDIKEKIFDPFFTTKNVGGGVGLGLSITYGIIQEHKGKIKVESDIKSGTVFTISLPCNINKA
jgi:signal transduction histidine kinase